MNDDGGDDGWKTIVAKKCVIYLSEHIHAVRGEFKSLLAGGGAVCGVDRDDEVGYITAHRDHRGWQWESASDDGDETGYEQRCETTHGRSPCARCGFPINNNYTLLHLMGNFNERRRRRGKPGLILRASSSPQLKGSVSEAERRGQVRVICIESVRAQANKSSLRGFGADEHQSRDDHRRGKAPGTRSPDDKRLEEREVHGEKRSDEG